MPKPNGNSGGSPAGTSLITITGDNNANTIAGTIEDELIRGKGGNDTLFGDAGDDILEGGAGSDILYTSEGADLLDGGKDFDKALYREAIAIDVNTIETGDYYSVLGYDITIGNGVSTITDIDPSDGNTGVDTLQNVEEAVFSDADADGDGVEGLINVFLDGRNNAALAVTDTFSGFNEDTQGAISAGQLLANDREFDGEVLAISSVDTNSTRGTLSVNFNPDGTVSDVSYDPTSAYDYLSAGEVATDSFYYTAVDPDGSGTTTLVTLTIEGRNDAPILTSAAVGLSETAGETDSTANVGMSGSLSFTDADLNDTGHKATLLSVASSGTTVGLPDTATLVSFLTLGLVTKTAGSDSGTIGWSFGAEDRVFDYLDAGETVTLTYTVELDDGDGGVDTAEISLTVTGTNDVPVVSDLSDNLTEDGEYHIAASDLLALASDVDAGAEITLASVTGAVNGSVAIDDKGTADSADDEVVFTPVEDYSGPASFEFIVDDGSGEANGTATGTVNLDVDPVVDAPTLVVSDASGNEDAAIKLDVSAMLADTDGSESLTVVISGIPEGAILNWEEGGPQSITASSLANGIRFTNPSADLLASLTIQPPENSDEDLTISVVAVASEVEVSSIAVIDFESLVGGGQNGIFTTYGVISEDGYRLQPGINGLFEISPDNDQLPSFGYVTTDSTALAAFHEPVTLTREDGALFDVHSIDLEQLRTSYSGGSTITLSGMREDGTAVSVSVSIDQIAGAQTYYLGTEFMSLVQFTIDTGFVAQFDNIVLTESSASTSATIDVTVNAVADAPDVVVYDAAGNEDTAIQLDLSAALADTDGSESLKLELLGLPANFEITDGTNTASSDGTTPMVVTGWDLATLQVIPAPDFNGEITVEVVATSVEARDAFLDFVVAGSYGSDANRIYEGDDNFGFDDTGVRLENLALTYDVSMGDVDGDGDTDVVLSGDNRYGRLYLNQGDGTFTDSGQQFPATFQGRNELADIDNDGDLDLVFNNTNAAVDIYRNDGTGNFALSQSVDPAPYIYGNTGAIFGDVNGDDFVDMFVTVNGVDVLYLNDGTGLFSDSGQIFASGTTYRSSFGDVNGDGALDLVTSGYNGNASRVYLNDGTGTLVDTGQDIGEANAGEVILGDVDGDGDLDAIIAGQTEVRLQLNDGNGIFSDGGQIAAEGGGRIELADLDLDGDLDLGRMIGGVTTIFDNNGGGIFTAVNTITSPTAYSFGFAFLGETATTKETVSITIAAVNDAPVLTSNAGVTVDEGVTGSVIGSEALAMTDVDNSAAELSYTLTNGPAKGVLLLNGAALGVSDSFTQADLDGGLVTYDHDGSETVSDSFEFDVSDGTETVSAQSFEITVNPVNDAPVAIDDAFTGAPDIVVANFYSQSNQLLINDGVGNFTPDVLSSALVSSVNVDLADVDGDGDLDAFVSNQGANQLLINTNGVFTSTDFDNSDRMTSSAQFADLNNDGLLDVFVGNYNNVMPTFGVYVVNHVLIQQTDGSFVQSDVSGGAQSTYDIELGDFNNDGLMDAFVVNYYSGNQVLLNTGDGVSYDVTTLPYATEGDTGVALGDLNGDGHLDAFVTVNNGVNRILINDGTGNFTETIAPGGSFTSTDADIGDLNGDGLLDIFIGNASDQSNQILINDGMGGFDVYAAPGGGISHDVKLADLDGDGDLDVAIANDGDNQVLINSGDGITYEVRTIAGTSGTSIGLAIGDIDGDGLSEDKTVTLRVLDNDKDIEGDKLTINAVDATSALGAALVISTDGRTVLYDPTAAVALQSLDAGDTTTDTFSYTIVDDLGATGTASVSILVRGENDAPVVSDLSDNLTEDGTYRIAASDLLALASDVDAGAEITLASVTGAVNGSVSIDDKGTADTADDEVVFAPVADYSGPASFEFIVDDGSGEANGTATGTVNLGVAPVADAPIITFGTLSSDPTITTPEALTGDIQVNTTTTDAQRYSSITALSDGGFIVTWSSLNQDGSDWGVYGQRYDAAGAVVGGEFQVNTEALSYQVNSSVAALSDGGFIVTWSSFSQDGSGYDIYGQHYDANGATFGGEFQVNTESVSEQNYSSVEVLSDGGFVVTWSSWNQDGSGYGIFGQRYDANGVVSGDEFQVNTETLSYQTYSSVAALSDGGFIVTWSSFSQDGSGYGIFGQRYNATGAVSGGEILINTHTTGNQDHSSVAALSDGGFVVTWTSLDQDGSGYGIFGQRYDATGVVSGGEFLINTETLNNQLNSSVAALPDGGFVVTWSSYSQDGSTSWGIYGQRFAADGATVGDEFRMNETTVGTQFGDTHYGSEITAVLANGTLVSTWTGAGSEEVFVRMFDTGTDSSLYDSPFDLPVSISLSDTDGSEGIGAVSLIGLPADFEITDGTNTTISDGSTPIDVSGWALDLLHVTPVSGFRGTITIEVTATTSETLNGNTVTGSSIFYRGSSADDNFVGADGSDQLTGGFGQDTLTGGKGDDVLTGGDGYSNDFNVDEFVFNSGDGSNLITDFEDGIDVINVASFGLLDASGFTISDDGLDKVIQFNDLAGTEVRLSDAAGITIDEADFIF